MVWFLGYGVILRNSAIGVFDSGVGGLTVFKEVSALLPEENLIYLGDTARVPYGTKSVETVQRYAQEAAGFLVARGVKLLVVACNTASAVALPILREKFHLPVIGVIEPGARKASQSLNQRIGVIGTEGTINSGRYPEAILKLLPNAQIFSAACPLFVPLAEEGWAEHEIARLTAVEYLQGLMTEQIDTLVLGCTHYPLLRRTLRQVVGERVVLVDSAEETAKSVVEILHQKNLSRSSFGGERQFFVTDIPTRFERVGRAFLGAQLDKVRQVEIN